MGQSRGMARTGSALRKRRFEPVPYREDRMRVSHADVPRWLSGGLSWTTNANANAGDLCPQMDSGSGRHQDNAWADDLMFAPAPPGLLEGLGALARIKYRIR